ncbi:hypothetical protein B4U79_18691 [Dinothrombium tinctorium]|uniref:Uncharacterized protein n=1 Tax=Dinothrombium tinctorium TaxID=1965070 RepID=A0A3S3P3S5_9ACAR|nr:hypothetical protein B4U79_18691 [Dinothrombium tinctorium]
MFSKQFIILLTFFYYFSSSDEANPCKYGKIDGIIWSLKARKNTSVMIFSEDYFYNFDFETEKLSKGREIKEIWPEVEMPISGASEVNEFINRNNYEEEIVFFKDPKYWVYPSKSEYLERQTLIRSGIIKFFDDENISYSGLIMKIFSTKTDSTYRVFYTTKNKTIHSCGSVEEKKNGSYEIIVGDPKKMPTNESTYRTDCESFVKVFGTVVSLAARPFQNGRYAVYTNNVFFTIMFSENDINFNEVSQKMPVETLESMSSG